MAPKTRMPSRPRLMRPERSVMASPSDTKMKGVETRMAPPRMASGTLQKPSSLVCIASVLLRPAFGIEDSDASVKRVAEQDDDEDHALQDEHRGVGQIHAALDQAARSLDAAEQHGDRNDRQ